MAVNTLARLGRYTIRPELPAKQGGGQTRTAKVSSSNSLEISNHNIVKERLDSQNSKKQAQSKPHADENKKISHQQHNELQLQE